MVNNLDQAVDNSVQRVNITQNPEAAGSGMSVLMILSRAYDLVAPWWSPKRDDDLRAFWKQSDHLAGAIYAMVTKMTTIPLRVVPRDESIKSHHKIAEQYTDMLLNGAQFGEGWMSFFSQWVEEISTQDNGAFAEIIGMGDPSGPITGRVISIAHLDSANCVRTGNAEYPVIYRDRYGNRYKLHWTRVLFDSQLRSPKDRMNGVGVCALSRAINASQNLLDMSVYKQEKLGSRPPRQLMLAKGGLDPEDVQEAIAASMQNMNNQGLSRFSKTIVFGSNAIPDAEIDVIDLAKAPDGFDEEKSTVLGMAVVALAFGMDARELFPVNLTGATKADAIIQHIKQRGKGPGHILQRMENLLDQKVLPPFLKAVFDFQDDAQDRQNAEINNIRSQARQFNLASGQTDVRVSREKMMEAGELTHEQFVYLELKDGRLEDGNSVEVLFHSDDPVFVQFLGGNGERENKKIEIMKVISTSRDAELISKARMALAALEFEEKKELEAQEKAMVQRERELGITRVESAQQPDTTYQRDKFSRTLPRTVTSPPDEEENYAS